MQGGSGDKQRVVTRWVSPLVAITVVTVMVGLNIISYKELAKKPVDVITSKIPERTDAVDLSTKDMEPEGSSDGSESVRPSCYKSSILPKRIYTVLGLESSGTSFTAKVIKDGLGIRKTREAHRPYPKSPGNFTVLDYEMEEELIQTQHFSLPWGSSCQQQKETPIVDVVLPTQCTRDHPLSEQDDEEVQRCCNEMADDLFGIRPNGQPVKYPPRYNLDIVSHKDWYDRHGVEQWMVIVLRDPDISIAARSHRHCTVKERLVEEEQAGKDIIIDAINKYILEEDERKVTRETYKFWYAKKFQNKDMEGVGGGSGAGRNLRALSSGAGIGLTARNNVVLVSYESMMGLGDVYIKMLYETLGIETENHPKVKNGNTKYVINE